jgi:hypothetical protein
MDVDLLLESQMETAAKQAKKTKKTEEHSAGDG